MPILLRLSWRNLTSDPRRTLLTLAAMTAAAALAAWMVAGFDRMLPARNSDPELLGRAFDSVLLASSEQNSLDGVLVELMLHDPRVAQAKLFSVPVRVELERASASAVPVPSSGKQVRRSRGFGARPLLPDSGYCVVAASASESPYPMRSGMWLDSASEPDLPFPRPQNFVLPDFPAVLSESFANSLHVSVGDKLESSSGAGGFRLRIVGIMADGPDSRKFPLIPSGFDSLLFHSSRAVFVHWRTAELIAGGELRSEHVMFALHSPDSAPAFQSDWQSRAKGERAYLATRAEALRAMRLNAPVSGSDARSMLHSWSAAALTIIASFFIIYNTLNMDVEERSAMFALLRIAGFRRRAVAAIIFGESIFYGVAGWLGGIASAAILLAILSVTGSAHADFHIGIWTVLLTGLCSIAGAAAAAIAPMCRVARLAPLDALRPAELCNAPSVSLRPLFIGLSLLLIAPAIVLLPGLRDLPRIRLFALLGGPAAIAGFVLLAPAVTDLCIRLAAPVAARCLRLHPWMVSARLRADLRRISGSVVALTVGLGLYIMILIWSASLLVPFLPGEWIPDYFVSILPGGLDSRTAALAANLPGVNPQKCLPASIEQLAVNRPQSPGSPTTALPDNVVLVGVDPQPAFGSSDPLFPFRFLEPDRASALRLLDARKPPYPCLIPHYFAHTSGLKPGDSFTLLPPEAGDSPVEFRVAGVIEMYGWHWFSKLSGTRRTRARTAAMLFTSRTVMIEAFGSTRVNFLWMDLLPDANEDTLADAVEQLAGQCKGQTFHVRGMGDSVVGRESVRTLSKAQIRQSLEQRANTMVDGLLRMPLLILLVVSISVVNTILASARAGRPEFGLYRTIGLSASGLLRMILLEGFFIALAASILSLAFGLFSGLCSAQLAAGSELLGGMQWAFRFPFRPVFSGIALTFLLALLAAAVPAVLWGKKSPLDLIRRDE